MSRHPNKFNQSRNQARGVRRPLRSVSRFQPRIERLEERRLLTIFFHPVQGPEHAVDLGGTKLTDPSVYLIFDGPGQTWGDVNTQQLNAPAQAIVDAAINLINSSYFAGLNRSNYGLSGAIQLGGVRIDGTQLPDQFQPGDIDSLVDDEVDNYLPDDSSNLYFVITPPGVLSGTPGAGGYHITNSDLAEGWVSSPGEVPVGSPAFVDDVATGLSHEFVESMTDPFGDGIVEQPAGPLGNEIADNEPEAASNDYVYRVNGTLAQAFWSEADGAFLVNDGTNQAFDVTGGVLTVNGDQILLPTNDTITVGTTAAGGVSVTLNGETANFEPGQVNSVVLNPGGSFQGFNHINVHSTNVPVTINDTDPHGDSLRMGQNGTVQGIQAKVTIHNSSSFTALAVDDYFDQYREFDINSDNLHVSGAGEIAFLGAPLYSLDVAAGGQRSASGGNLVFVTGIAGQAGEPAGRTHGTSVTFYAGYGSDQVFAGNNLDSMLGSLKVNGHGRTRLVFDDHDNLADQVYTIGTDFLNRSGLSGGFVFSQLGDLTVLGSHGSNRFKLAGQPASPVELQAGKSGNNVLTAPTAQNNWLIQQSYQGTLTVGNSPAVSFSFVQHLDAGAGADTFGFTVNAIVASIDGGGGGDWLDYSRWHINVPVTVNLTTGSATGVIGGISKIQNVIGGSGDDVLTGMPGGNILIGGRGNDTLVGGPDGNLLIGGSGTDTLKAGAGGDIVIGGLTKYDASTAAHRAALQSILDEWRTDQSPMRIDRLMGIVKFGIGLNGTNFLNSNTVHDDHAVDTLDLGAGLDWYFVNSKGKKDQVQGLGANDEAYYY